MTDQLKCGPCESRCGDCPIDWTRFDPPMVTVPVEPTPEMVSACMDLLMSEALIYERPQGGLAVETVTPAKLWAAMLAAAKT